MYYVVVTRDSCLIWDDENIKTSKYRGPDLHRLYVSPETPRTTFAAELLQQGVPRGDYRPGGA
jgi:hypothetical protein